MIKLSLRKIGRQWWIIGDPTGPIGPYRNKVEAADIRRGLRRFEKFQNRPGYMTSDPVTTEGGER